MVYNTLIIHYSFTQVFMKTHFSFDPSKDRLLPCKEAGLPFSDGDILEILSQDDTNWWQVRWDFCTQFDFPIIQYFICLKVMKIRIVLNSNKTLITFINLHMNTVKEKAGLMILIKLFMECNSKSNVVLKAHFLFLYIASLNFFIYCTSG